LLSNLVAIKNGISALRNKYGAGLDKAASALAAFLAEAHREARGGGEYSSLDNGMQPFCESL
jgi:hypothetical protein